MERLLPLVLTCWCPTALAASGEPLTISMHGTVVGIYGTLADASPFVVGDEFLYNVVLDDAITGPVAGAFESQDRSLISEFSATVGGYELSGGSGLVYMDNLTLDPGFGRFDRLLFEHDEAFVLAESGLSGDDIAYTDGPIVGQPVHSLNIVFVSRDHDLVMEGDHVADALENVIAVLDELVWSDVQDYARADLFFSDAAFGNIPLDLAIEFDHIGINEPVTALTYGYGTASASIIYNTYGETLAAFDASGESVTDVNTRAGIASTSGGLGAAHGEVLFAEAPEGPESVAGLEVGAYASSHPSSFAIGPLSSPPSITSSRALAFRAYRYEGADPTSIRVNATLDGEFGTSPFGLSSGENIASASVHVFDSDALESILTGEGVDLEQLFFPVADGGFGTADDPFALVEPTAGELLGLTALTEQSAEVVARLGPIIVPISTSFVATPGQTFTVLFDMSVLSNAGGSANFYNTLAADPAFFTDPEGNPILDVIAVGTDGLEGVNRPPLVELADDVWLETCDAQVAVELSEPFVSDPDGDPVTVSGVVVASDDAAVSIPVVNGGVTLTPGSHLVRWAAIDSAGLEGESYQVVLVRALDDCAQEEVLPEGGGCGCEGGGAPVGTSAGLTVVVVWFLRRTQGRRLRNRGLSFS